MNAGELKAELADVPDDWPVVMSIDPEGNGFQHLSEVNECRWHEEWREIKSCDAKDLPPAIVLWP